MTESENISSDSFREYVVSKPPDIESVAMFAQCRSPNSVEGYYLCLQELVYVRERTKLAPPSIHAIEGVEENMTDPEIQDTVDSYYVGRGRYQNRLRGTFRRGPSSTYSMVCYNCGKRGHMWRQCRNELKA